MAYTIDPHAPRVRRDAAAFAKKYGVRTAARRYGVSPGTVTKWMQKAKKLGEHPIPTKSSRPKRHPQQLSDELVWKIFHTRLSVNRSAEVVHAILKEKGVTVSLSSVKRTLDRTGLLKKRSPYGHLEPASHPAYRNKRMGFEDEERQGARVQQSVLDFHQPVLLRPVRVPAR